MKMLRACDVFRGTAAAFADLTDAELRTACPVCKMTLTLDACPFQPTQEPTYRCPNCQSVVLTIGKVGCGRGNRFGEHVIINESDLMVRNVGIHASHPARDKLS